MNSFFRRQRVQEGFQGQRHGRQRETKLVIAAVLLTALAIPIYFGSNQDPRRLIVGDWYRLSNDSSTVTFNPGSKNSTGYGGSLVVHYERFESDVWLGYNFLPNGSLEIKGPGSDTMAGQPLKQLCTITFLNANTMTLDSNGDPGLLNQVPGSTTYYRRTAIGFGNR